MARIKVNGQILDTKGEKIYVVYKDTGERTATLDEYTDEINYDPKILELRKSYVRKTRTKGRVQML